MPDLLLVGAGHAHLYVVKHAGELRAAGYRVQLLAPRFFDYSGVASATAAGALSSDAGRIDVRSLASASSVEFHEGTLESLDPETRIAVTSDGDHLYYDVLSVKIGSVVAPAGMHVHPAVLRVKPLSGLADLDARLRASGQQGATVTVVGGGASGLELAAHLSVRSDVVQIRLVESGTIIGAGLPEGARKRIVRLLATRGVAVRTGCVVRDLGERQLVCEDDTEMSHDVALLATGLTAPPLLAEVGLGDGHGVPVRATLQHVGRDDIYAVATVRGSSRVRCPVSACTGCGKDLCCSAACSRGFGETLFPCTSRSAVHCRFSISVTASVWLSGGAGGGTAPVLCDSSGTSIDGG